MHPQAEHTTHHTALHSLFDALRPLSLAPLWTRYTQLLTLRHPRAKHALPLAVCRCAPASPAYR